MKRNKWYLCNCGEQQAIINYDTISYLFFAGVNIRQGIDKDAIHSGVSSEKSTALLPTFRLTKGGELAHLKIRLAKICFDFDSYLKIKNNINDFIGRNGKRLSDIYEKQNKNNEVKTM